MTDDGTTAIPGTRSYEVLKEALDALDTAHGCLELVAADTKPVDLKECQKEIAKARTTVAKELGYV